MNGECSEPLTTEAHTFTITEGLHQSQRYCEVCKSLVDAWPWAKISHHAVAAMKVQDCPLCQFIFTALNLERRVANWEKNNLITFDSWADEGDPHQGIAKLRSPITYLASDLVVNGFREMIKSCSEKHTTCRTLFGDFLANPATLPSTVLQVDDDHGDIRIHNPAPGERAPYTTLSYVWGKGIRSADREAIVDKIKTFYKENGFIKSECLPLCFRDAVELTRRFRIKYLWIDCLCVAQDKIKDRNRAISDFSTIFENSAVCIRPGNIDGVHQSFLRKKGPYPLSPVCTVRVTDSEGKVIKELKFTTQRNDATSGMERFHGPLRLRSWTLAEAFVSPRQITITTHNEMTYSCLETHHSGGYPFFWAYTLNESYNQAHYCKTVGLSWVVKYDKIPRVTPTWEQWWKIVSDIHQGDIDRAEDRPLMLNAIAQHPIWGDAYLLGLWRTNARELLLWKTEIRVHDRLPVVRLPDAPTWSWASTSGRASYYDLAFMGNWQIEVKDWIHGLPPRLRLYQESVAAKIILEGKCASATEVGKFQGEATRWHYYKDTTATHASSPISAEDGVTFLLLGQLNYGGNDNHYAAPSKGTSSNEKSGGSKTIEGDSKGKEPEASNIMEVPLPDPMESPNMHEDSMGSESKARRRSIFEWFGTKTTDFGDSQRSRISAMKQKLPRPTYKFATAFSQRKSHHESSFGAQKPLSQTIKAPQDNEEEAGQNKHDLGEERDSNELGWRCSFEGNADSYPAEFMSLDPKDLAEPPNEKAVTSELSETGNGQATQPLPTFSAVEQTAKVSPSTSETVLQWYKTQSSAIGIPGSRARLVLGRPTLMMALKRVSRNTYERTGIVDQMCTEETIAFWSSIKKEKISLI